MSDAATIDPSKLSGAELDRAVGLANGWTIGEEDPFSGGRWILPDGTPGMLVAVYRPSTRWEHGGPLIDLLANRVDTLSMEIFEHPQGMVVALAQVLMGGNQLEAYGSPVLLVICRLWVAMRSEA